MTISKSNSKTISKTHALEAIGTQNLQLIPLTYEVDESLYLEEIKLEKATMEAAEAAYLKATERLEQSGAADETSYGRKLLADGIIAVTEALTKWMEVHTSKPKGGRNHLALEPLSHFDDLRVVANIALATIIGSCGKADQERTALALRISKRLEDELNLRLAREHDKTLYKKMVSAAKNKHEYRKKQDAVNYLARLNAYEQTSWNNNTSTSLGLVLIEAVINTTGIIEQNLVPTWNSKKGRTDTPYIISVPASAQAMIQKHKELAASMNVTYRPMVVPPLDWEKGMVRGGGYLTNFVTPLRLVKTHSRKTLDEYANVNMPTVLDAMNAAQRTPWRINKKVLELLEQLPPSGIDLKKLQLHLPEPVQKPDDIAQLAEAHKAQRIVLDYVAKNNDREADGLPPLECPATVPTWYDDAAEARYKNYRKQSVAYWKKVNRVHSYTRSYHDVLEIAKVYQDYERIYMPYTLDFRGRIYCAAILSPQGADHVKALIQFADAEPIGKEGITWLKLHAANLMGDDKAPFDERIKWAEDNWEEMCACARDPFEFRMWSKADKPMQAYATCLEVLGVEENGEDHICRVPIALDGSCSGIQIFSAMLRDEIGGAAVNLVPADRPQDIYSLVKDKVIAEAEGWAAMNVDVLADEWLAGNNSYEKKFRASTSAQIKQDMYNYIENPVAVKERLGKTKLAEVMEITKFAAAPIYARQWLKFGIVRGTAKRPVMTFPYGARRQGFKDQLMDDVIKPAYNKHVEKYGEAAYGVHDWCFHGTGYHACDSMAGWLWKGVSATVVKAAEMMEWLRTVAALAVRSGLPIQLESPLGFRMVQDYRKQGERVVKCTFQGKATYTSLRAYMKGKKFVDNEWEADLDKMRSQSGISPNTIHMLDSTLLMLIVATAKAEGINHFALIHDSFGTTAARTARFYHIIRECFVRLFTDWDVLKMITDQLIAQVPEEYQDEIPEIPMTGSLDLEAVKQSVYCFL